MATNEVDFVYKENFKVLQKSMGILFNNVNFSDTTFTVKEKKFYALSQLVSVTSPTLDTLTSSHFANCSDHEIKINDVKYEESFSVILRYIYGLEINFTQMNRAILCEVLNLSETYQLREFTEDLKTFVSKIDSFHLDSLVVLLNTAKKFNLADLYEKLTMFAYKHADEFVKHISLVDLQYDVLLDLLPSDSFCTPEIGILRGVLKWHADMYKEKDESIAKATLAKESDYDDQRKQDSDVSDCDTDVTEFTDALSHAEDESKVELDLFMEKLGLKNNTEDELDMSSDEDGSHEEAKKKDRLEKELDLIMEKLGLKNNAEDELSTAPDEDGSHEEEKKEERPEKELDHHLASTSQNEEKKALKTPNSPSELVKSFSENILKSLLVHIRFKLISAFDYIEALKAPLFLKQKDLLSDTKLFSQSEKPRKLQDNLEETPVVAIECPPADSFRIEEYFDIHTTFYVKNKWPEIYETESFKLGSMRFDFSIDLYDCARKRDDDTIMYASLCFRNDNEAWECSVELGNVILIPEDARFDNKTPQNPNYKKPFTVTEKSVHKCDFLLYRIEKYMHPKTFRYSNIYLHNENNYFIVKVHFKSVKTKVMLP